MCSRTPTETVWLILFRVYMHYLIVVLASTVIPSLTHEHAIRWCRSRANGPEIWGQHKVIRWNQCGRLDFTFARLQNWLTLSRSKIAATDLVCRRQERRKSGFGNIADQWLVLGIALLHCCCILFKLAVYKCFSESRLFHTVSLLTFCFTVSLINQQLVISQI